ncbi:winged helix-turn-helix domain-containing protein [Haloactinopolyspora alba]|uniref:winged helix-turn-helix domain-containing protein n=1 Tax=Haloactinopolyspora alba TaxID=648780 RepID=UPI0013EC86C8|nr:winged helix-turn-helix domain-containing protein [Haloactinopolyspora alba]
MSGAGALDAVLASLDDGLIIAGLDGRVTFHNAAAARLLGVTGGLLAGACLNEIGRQLGIRSTASQPSTSMHVTATVAGRRRKLRLRSFPVRDSRAVTLGVGYLVEDITSPKRIVLRHRDLELDMHAMTARVRGRRVTLTRTELALLRLFMENPGTTLRHARVLRQIWGPKYGDEAHYVRVYVNRLRRKIEADPANPTYLVTERGIGYRFAG